MKETMTVHEALCELKTLRKRVEEAIAESVPIRYKEVGSSTVDGKSVQDAMLAIKSAHQSVTDLINRMIAIKAAINQYNAEKKVQIGEAAYSIAQAIYMKSFGMDTKRALLDQYRRALKHATTFAESANGEKLNNRAEAAMTAIYGAKEKSDPEAYLKGLMDYKKQHTVELIDPLNLAKVVKEMEDEINTFESKMDSAIQIANATTQIEIEY